MPLHAVDASPPARGDPCLSTSASQDTLQLGQERSNARRQGGMPAKLLGSYWVQTFLHSCSTSCQGRFLSWTSSVPHPLSHLSTPAESTEEIVSGPPVPWLRWRLFLMSSTKPSSTCRQQQSSVLF